MKSYKTISVVIVFFFSISANAALIERLGGKAYYDNVLDITWLADSNYAQTSGYSSNGMTWEEATAWVSGLNIDGITGWRLPNVKPINDVAWGDGWSSNGTLDLGLNISAPDTLFAGSKSSELAHLFYNTLGNISGCDPILSTLDCVLIDSPEYGLINTDPFNFSGDYVLREFWSATGYLYDSNPVKVTFDFERGVQLLASTDILLSAWAVRDGDISSVPVPIALWLFGSGFIGLFSMARRKRCT